VTVISCTSVSMFRLNLFVGLFSVILIMSSCESVAPPNEAEIADSSTTWPQEITERMESQENAWNQGDVNAFMKEAYWPSDSMLFIGKSGMTWGYDATLNNYLKSYPNKAAMGTLKFKNKHWMSLGIRHGLLVGEWLLIRSDSLEDLAGSYSLIWERKAGRWMIIADHSS
jgi:hypothetical protein